MRADLQYDEYGVGFAPDTNRTKAVPQSRVPLLGVGFNTLDAEKVRALLAARRPDMPFEYVVTPNVQHVVTADRDATFKADLAAAWLCVCDSHPVRLISRFAGTELPVVTGSDLTVALFEHEIVAGDRISVICASESLAMALRVFRPDVEWDIMVPPQGTVPGTRAFEACVDFIASGRSRLTFVCLGAPKSEAMCRAASLRHDATGTALCTGAALEFMLGIKARAPRLFRRLGIEWVHRMVSEPRRLARRYLSAFVPLARIWLREHRRS